MSGLSGTGTAYPNGLNTPAGKLFIEGVAMSATAAELNLINGVTAGTATASKALVLGANKNIDTLVIAASGLKIGTGTGTAVTSTAVELNTVAGVAAGTATASKALVLGTDKNIDTIVIAASGLKIGSGAGTAVTATAAELNKVAGVTAGTSTASKALVLGATKNVDTLLVDGVFQLGTTTTAALALGGGTSASPLTTATTDKNFVGMYTQSTATSGDSRGAYVKHVLGGTIATTGYGDAVRAYCSVTGTGYSYASGIHASMSLAASATITGSGAGARCTLGAAADTRTLPGNIAALQIDSDIATGNTVPATAALIRLAKAGAVDVTTFLHIEDDQCLKGSAATGAAGDALKVIMPNGDVKYISLIAAS